MYSGPVAGGQRYECHYLTASGSLLHPTSLPLRMLQGGKGKVDFR